MTRPVPAAEVQPVLPDLRTAMAEIPRVRRGLDPRPVDALLRAAQQQIDQARAARAIAEDEAHRAKAALRRWQSEHSETCQMPVVGRPSRLRLPIKP